MTDTNKPNFFKKEEIEKWYSDFNKTYRDHVNKLNDSIQFKIHGIIEELPDEAKREINLLQYQRMINTDWLNEQINNLFDGALTYISTVISELYERELIEEEDIND